MNVYFFRDENRDEVVIVSAVSLQSAEAILDREVTAARITATFGTKEHVSVDDALNLYTVKQQVRDANMTSERVLFQVDVTTV